MAEETTKQTPAGLPPMPGDLAARIGPAGVAPADVSGIRIRLEVTGGSAAERYEFKFEVHGPGEFTTTLLDRMRKTEKDIRFGKVSREDVARILKSVDARRLAEAARVTRPIPPDSVVGRLTIADGREEVSVVFMADPDQAKTAGVRLDPALGETVERIYRLAARHLKVKRVKP